MDSTSVVQLIIFIFVTRTLVSGHDDIEYLNRTKRNFNFLGGFGANPNGIGGGGGINGPFGGGGVGGGLFGGGANVLGPTGGGLFGLNYQQYNPNRISDCPTTEYNRTGVCETSPYDCRRKGGRVVGQCFATPITGSGSINNNLDVGGNDYNNRRVPVGICCVYQVTCGGTILHNGTYFRSPNSPAPYNEARACSVTIPRINPAINFIRLDFVSFNLAKPKDGICDTDKFIVDGHAQNAPVPALCGYNTGQHMYLELDRSNNPTTLTVITGQLLQNLVNRNFDIRVTFIHFLSPYKPPNNCLQYYYDLSGTFKSFNYDSTTNQLSTAVSPFQYMRNLDYAICFKKLSGYCSITYSMPGFSQVQDGLSLGDPSQQTNRPILKFFNIANDPSKGGLTGSGPLKCPDDYLILNSMRFCGNALVDDPQPTSSSSSASTPITDNGTGPLIARFVTGNDETVGPGFILRYQLNHCFFAG